MLAPPIGGILYSRFGFRGPFIFSLIAAFIDLVSRFIIIEPKEAMKWGSECGMGPKSDEPPIEAPPKEVAMTVNIPGPLPRVDFEDQTGPKTHAVSGASEENGIASSIQVADKPLSLVQVMLKLSNSPRALVALVISFVYGYNPSTRFRSPLLTP